MHTGRGSSRQKVRSVHLTRDETLGNQLGVKSRLYSIMFARLSRIHFWLLLLALWHGSASFETDWDLETLAYDGEAICDEDYCDHQINKRQITPEGNGTMKDFIKFLLRGNKTKDDELNTLPYVAGNLSLGTSGRLDRSRSLHLKCPFADQESPTICISSNGRKSSAKCLETPAKSSIPRN